MDDFIRSVFDGSTWVGTKIGLIKQAEHNHQALNVELDPKFRRHLWTQAHSLYATMGGFVVDTHGLELNYLPEGRQRMTLTLEALKFIANWAPDILPDLPESAILDKSKANAFTKFVTCGQASWFGVQCLTRSAQGLSTPLLEINTAVHAICTLIMCALFWWHKPLDVEEPTVLTDALTHPAIAFLVAAQMYQSTQVSLMDMDMEENDTSESGITIRHPRLKHILLRSSRNPSFPSPLYLVYRGFAIPARRSISDIIVDDLTQLDFDRLNLASNAIRKYGSYSEIRSYINIKKDYYLSLRLCNRPSHRPSGSSLIGFPLAGLFYGSIHLAVWNRPFRAETDELLWKISSLTILSSGIPFVVGVWCFDVLSEPVNNLFPRRRRIYFLCKAITRPFFACFTLFYIFCRTFIIVECFLDLFHLPDSAFEVPQWSQYFPHIG